MKAFGIIGKPVGHSKSPAIMNAAFNALNDNARYFYVVAKNLNDSIQVLKQFGFSGANITAPYKEEIIAFTRQLSIEAQAIGAVNTILFKDKEIYGYNTDYLGVSGTLNSKGVDFKDKRILIIGAGGAAKAALFALKKESSHVGIVNRSPEKAEQLAEKWEINSHPWKDLFKIISEHDIIINTIPFVQILFDAIALEKGHIVFDANYCHSSLQEICQHKDVQFIDGKYWLLNQAYPAFKLFAGLDAPKEIMENAFDKNTEWKTADIINLTAKNHPFNNLSFNISSKYYHNPDDYKPSDESNNLVIGLCDKTTLVPDLKIFDMFVYIEGLDHAQMINLLNEETNFSIDC